MYKDLTKEQKLIYNKLTEVFYGHNWSSHDYRIAMICLSNRLKDGERTKKKLRNKTNNKRSV